MSAAACDHPVAFACEALFPGVVKAFRNPRDAEGWGRAAFDVAMYAIPALKACQVGGRLANLGKLGRVGYQAGNAGLKLNRFHQSAYNLTEIGQNNIRILRGWAKSKGWEKMPNPQGRPEIWGVNTADRFEFRLKIKAESSLRQGLDTGSGIPRFDARLSDGYYINPFTGEIGNSKIGTHIPLEKQFYE